LRESLLLLLLFGLLSVDDAELLVLPRRAVRLFLLVLLDNLRLLDPPPELLRLGDFPTGELSLEDDLRLLLTDIFALAALLRFLESLDESDEEDLRRSARFLGGESFGRLLDLPSLPKLGCLRGGLGLLLF